MALVASAIRSQCTLQRRRRSRTSSSLGIWVHTGRQSPARRQIHGDQNDAWAYLACKSANGVDSLPTAKSRLNEDQPDSRKLRQSTVGFHFSARRFHHQSRNIQETGKATRNIHVAFDHKNTSHELKHASISWARWPALASGKHQIATGYMTVILGPLRCFEAGVGALCSLTPTSYNLQAPQWGKSHDHYLCARR